MDMPEMEGVRDEKPANDYYYYYYYRYLLVMFYNYTHMKCNIYVNNHRNISGMNYFYFEHGAFPSRIK